MKSGNLNLEFIAFFWFTNVGGLIGEVFGGHDIDNPWFKTKS